MLLEIIFPLAQRRNVRKDVENTALTIRRMMTMPFAIAMSLREVFYFRLLSFAPHIGLH